MSTPPPGPPAPEPPAAEQTAPEFPTVAEPAAQDPAAPEPLVPPARLTCPHCGSGLPEGPALSACPACGTRLGGPQTPGTPPPGAQQQGQDGGATGGAGAARSADEPVIHGGMVVLDSSLPSSGDDPETAGAGDARADGGGAEGTGAAEDAGPEDGATVVSRRRGSAGPGGDDNPDDGPTVCPQCGGTYADGYCTQCGAARPLARHRMEASPAPWVAAVCDRGIRHTDNEDAMAVSADGARAALVVCDGVSTAPRSSEASLAAARAALAVLETATSTGLKVPGAREAALEARLGAATDAADEAVRRVAEEITEADHHERVRSTSPSCTFVAGVIEDDLLVVGSVGDSRAYWFPDEGEPLLLTTDDSLAQEQVRAGIGRAEAEQSPMAHTITRWIGPDSPDHTPATATVQLGAGWVLLCSDGLWNYASEPSALAERLREAEQQDADPVALARALVRWANDQGGHDNITVALARTGTAPAAGAGTDKGSHG